MNQPVSFCHWSGKLLCSFGLYRAQKTSKILCLVNLPPFGGKNASERIPLKILRDLADGLKLPLFTPTLSHETIHDDLKAFLELLDQKYLARSAVLNYFKNNDNHLNILEKEYQKTAFNIHNLIGDESPETLFEEAMNAGFKAYIFSVNEKFFSRNCLGSLLTLEMLQNFKKNNIHPFGLNGEFDAICVDGPNFENKVSLTFGDIHFKNGYWHREFTSTPS